MVVWAESPSAWEIYNLVPLYVKSNENPLSGENSNLPHE